MQTIQTEIGITPTGRQATRYTVQCEQGHRRVIYVSGDHARWRDVAVAHGRINAAVSFALTAGLVVTIMACVVMWAGR